MIQLSLALSLPPGCDASLPARADGAASLGAGADGGRTLSLVPSADGVVSAGADALVAGVLVRRCGWCERELGRGQLLWCSTKCRQTAWRARRIGVAEDLGDTPKRLAVSDPPYFGLSYQYYRNEPTFAGEVDHAALIARLDRDYDGWILACSAESLPVLLPLCPPGIRIGAWGKPGGVSSKTRGPHNRWEAVIYKSARLRRPGVPDFLYCPHARGGGTLMGRKPLRWCIWVFRLLGASHVDELADLFPGTGMITRAWRQFQAKASPRYRRDGRAASPRTSRDRASLQASFDGLQSCHSEGISS